MKDQRKRTKEIMSVNQMAEIRHRANPLKRSHGICPHSARSSQSSRSGRAEDKSSSYATLVYILTPPVPSWVLPWTSRSSLGQSFYIYKTAITAVPKLHRVGSELNSEHTKSAYEMSLLRVMNRGVCTHTHTPIPSRPVS